MFGLPIFKISEFSYNLKVLEKLFLVRTKDSNLVVAKHDLNKNTFKTKKVGIPSGLEDTKIAKEVYCHHPIKLTFLNELWLFLMQTFGCVCCYCSCSSDGKITRN